VGNKSKLRFLLTSSARRDIAAILKWSLREFGTAASLRYRALIRQALADLEADPARPGSLERPELMVEGARTWYISQSRARTPGGRVKEPRHFILYRRRQDGVVEVGRILHENVDLSRYLPSGYRRGDSAN